MGNLESPQLLCFYGILPSLNEILCSLWMSYTFGVWLARGVSTTRQRSGWLSLPGFESWHQLLKMKIRGDVSPPGRFFFFDLALEVKDN